MDSYIESTLDESSIQPHIKKKGLIILETLQMKFTKFLIQHQFLCIMPLLLF